MVAQKIHDSLNYLCNTASLFFKKTTQKLYIETEKPSNDENCDPYTATAVKQGTKVSTFFIIRGSIMGDFIVNLEPPFSSRDETLHETILQYDTLIEHFSRFDADPHGMLWLNLWLNFMGYNITLKNRDVLKLLAQLHSQKQPLWWKVSNLHNMFNGYGKSDSLNVELLERNFLTYTQPLLKSSETKKTLWVEPYNNNCTLCGITFDVLKPVKHVLHNVTYLLCGECVNNSVKENNIIMHGLASSTNVECRIFAAGNPYSTFDVLKSLAFDDDVRVRETVSLNVNATEEMQTVVQLQK